MHFDQRRCLSCRTSDKPTPYYPVSDFWFCSVQCYHDELYKFVPKEFGPDAHPTDDKEIDDLEQLILQKPIGYIPSEEVMSQLNAHLRKLVNTWNSRREAALANAKNTLYSRIEGEAKLQQNEREEKERITQEKEDEKQRKIDEKREAEEEKERLAQEARKAEEQKWRPKRFDI